MPLPACLTFWHYELCRCFKRRLCLWVQESLRSPTPTGKGFITVKFPADFEIIDCEQDEPSWAPFD